MFSGPMSNTLSVNLLFSRNSSEISDDNRQNLGDKTLKKMKKEKLFRSNTRQLVTVHVCKSLGSQIFTKPQQKRVITGDYVLNVFSFLFVLLAGKFGL